MKTRTLIFISILVSVALISIAGKSLKEISKEEAMKYYCNTWINPAYYEDRRLSGMWIMNVDGTFESYKKETSEVVSWRGKFEIEESWTDKEDNIWVKTKSTIYIGQVVWYNLERISDDGKTLESVGSTTKYPTEIDPTADTYTIYYLK
jgi:hypothetical protein